MRFRLRHSSQLCSTAMDGTCKIRREGHLFLTELGKCCHFWPRRRRNLFSLSFAAPFRASLFLLLLLKMSEQALKAKIAPLSA